MQELTAFQRDLLFVLSSLEPTDGTQLKRELERAKYSSVLSGRLYHNLDILVEKSLIRKNTGAGRANEYRLTRPGSAVIRDHHEWQDQYLNDAVNEEMVPQ
ncbi:helix-turn-helix transcriptional regulator [Halobellus captivus]|uniref:helix-turn-helix transcriptional regulator n=1 Tax=Halobellus captivus TaxID=2592614 RepID=UPI00119CB106|nr:helix-turn-helix transcriptional regulator [Halobellus captivus]